MHLSHQGPGCMLRPLPTCTSNWGVAGGRHHTLLHKKRQSLERALCPLQNALRWNWSWTDLCHSDWPLPLLFRGTIFIYFLSHLRVYSDQYILGIFQWREAHTHKQGCIYSLTVKYILFLSAQNISLHIIFLSLWEAWTWIGINSLPTSKPSSSFLSIYLENEKLMLTLNPANAWLWYCYSQPSETGNTFQLGNE